MKKRLLVAALLLGSTLGVYAQQTENKDAKYKVETNKFWSNWFISVGGGVQVYTGDSDTKQDFTDRLAPALDFSVGKWFTPVLGLRGSYNGLEANGYTFDGNNAFVSGGMNSDGYYDQDFKLANVHFDVLFNLTNALCGYKADRLYNIIPFAGAGILHDWDVHENETSLNAGIINRFRLNSNWDLNVEARIAYINERFDHESISKRLETLSGVTVGFTYNFPKSNWDRATVVTTGITEDEMQAVRDQLANCRDNGKKLNDQLTYLNNHPKTIVKEVGTDVLSPTLFVFSINSAKVSKATRVNVGYLAKIINADTSDKTYLVTGYADRETGSPSWNQTLSEKRADAINDVLVNEYNVSAEKIKKASKGGVDNMFYNDRRLNRCVIVE
ncbi:MAG: OmpA family protein [Bacteroidaceae bacterium]